jgi:nucleotide-binding universal stress UspA family protein
MTNVLIPTDFSENAWNAIRYGLQFFEAKPIDFYLLHVSLSERKGSGSENETVANGIVFDMKDTIGIKDKLLEVKRRIERSFSNTNHRFYALQEHSFFIEGIKRSVAEKRIDLILMGTKGASGLKEVTIGSRTGEVITRVKCPTLIIPEKARFVIPKEIVFPTDFNSYYKNKILLTLAEIMALNESALRVFHVTRNEQELSDSQLENKNFLEDFLEDKTHSFHFHAGQNIEDALSEFIEKNKINMIAMVAKNINFFQRLLFKPSIAKISYHTDTPFLVLHE